MPAGLPPLIPGRMCVPEEGLAMLGSQ
jgi:hypothetical protein